MDEIEEKIKERLNGRTLNIPKNIPKKIFFDALQEYKDLVKYIPKSILEYQESDDEETESETTIQKDSEESAVEEQCEMKTPRIRKIEQLQEKLKALKGKSLSEVDALKRKGLKNRIKKKTRLEERLKERLKKQTVEKQEKNKHPNKLSVKVEEVQNNKSEPKEVIFSKFDFPAGIDDEKKKKGPTDPLRRLQKAQKSKNKLKEMEKRGRTEKVKEIKERLAWDHAIQKAEGGKIKDDVELLKKSLRKKKNEKNRSKKKWEQRESIKTQKKEETQKKRKENLLNKKKEKRKKKMKKLIKKGRIAP